MCIHVIAFNNGIHFFFLTTIFMFVLTRVLLFKSYNIVLIMECIDMVFI